MSRLGCAAILVLAALACTGAPPASEKPVSQATPVTTTPTGPPTSSGERPRPGAPVLLESLGEHHRRISTKHPLTQRYFDQGLALTYGFDHDSAIRAFEAALEDDPKCAMCVWGIAYALGPNINAPMGPDAAKRAYAETQRAQGLLAGATPVEQDLIRALTKRYAPDAPADRAHLDRAFALEMRAVQKRHPNDTDVATLAAEAMMDTTPWDYWTDDAQPREFTPEIVALLEWVLEREPDHIGANHYYIHAREEFDPDLAVAAADRLVALGLDTGHLVHMPSHIYWRVGRYGDAFSANDRAIRADETYFAWCRPGAYYRSAYYGHNLHFLWAAAMAQGRSAAALTAARKLTAETEPAHAEFPFLEEFYTAPILTLVRFGKWDAVLGEPEPPQGRPFQAGIRHYARGLAYTRTGRVREAKLELASLRGMIAQPTSEALIVAGGSASAAKLMRIGEAHLEGEIAAAEKDTRAAIAALSRAVAQQDALAYIEPPPWYFPTRQALGAVLVESGRAAEAEEVYLRDLEQYPKNGWSLFGLSAALRAQGKQLESDWAYRGFVRAWQDSDVALTASRF